jgi:hypothetical protein
MKRIITTKKSGQDIVIGALANDKTSPLGSYNADDNSAVSLVEGLQI